jgi:hypothetical protein
MRKKKSKVAMVQGIPVAPVSPAEHRLAKAIALTTNWFSTYHREVITPDEAWEFIRRLPRAIVDLQRIQNVVHRGDRT